MAEASQIVFTIQGHDRNMRRLLKDITKGGDRLTVTLGRITAESQRAQSTMGGWLGGLGRQFASAVGMAQPLVLLIRTLISEWETMLQKQRESLEVNARFQQAQQRNLLFAAGREREGIDDAFLNRLAMRMSAEGMEPLKARQTLDRLLSAGGIISPQEIEEAGVMAAQIERRTGVAAGDIGTAAEQIMGRTGWGAGTSVDAVSRALAMQRVETLEQSSKYTGAAITSWLETGLGTPEERVKMGMLTMGYYTHGAADPTGAQSRTASVATARIFARHVPIDIQEERIPKYTTDFLGRTVPTGEFETRKREVYAPYWVGPGGVTDPLMEILARGTHWAAGRDLLHFEPGQAARRIGGLGGPFIGAGLAAMTGLTELTRRGEAPFGLDMDFSFHRGRREGQKMILGWSSLFGQRDYLQNLFVTWDLNKQARMLKRYNLGTRSAGMFPKAGFITGSPEAKEWEKQNLERLEGLGEARADISELFPTFDTRKDVTRFMNAEERARQQSLLMNPTAAVWEGARDIISGAFRGETGLGEGVVEKYLKLVTTAKGRKYETVEEAKLALIKMLEEIAQTRMLRTTGEFVSSGIPGVMGGAREARGFTYEKTPSGVTLWTEMNALRRDMNLEELPPPWESNDPVLPGDVGDAEDLNTSGIGPLSMGLPLQFGGMLPAALGASAIGAMPMMNAPKLGARLMGTYGELAMTGRIPPRMYERTPTGRMLEPIGTAVGGGISSGLRWLHNDLQQTIDYLTQGSIQHYDPATDRFTSGGLILDAWLTRRSRRAVQMRMAHDEQQWREEHEAMMKWGTFHQGTGELFNKLQRRQATEQILMGPPAPHWADEHLAKTQAIIDKADASLRETQTEQNSFWGMLKELFSGSRVSTINGQGFYEGANPLDGVFH